jgi:hypothetical protein
MTIEFAEFGKIARLSRNCVISEKIDGTNASVYIGEAGEFLTGSRTRWITPEDDNYGFARWAHEHRDELMMLGPGHHFGEWWGLGIQRKYGVPDKRWSLFNTHRWCPHGTEPQMISNPNPKAEAKFQTVLPACIGLVPVMFKGVFTTEAVNECLDLLKTQGSFAAPGFMNPEGVVIYHEAAKTYLKKTIAKDDEPKGKA